MLRSQPGSVRGHRIFRLSVAVFGVAIVVASAAAFAQSPQIYALPSDSSPSLSTKAPSKSALDNSRIDTFVPRVVGGRPAAHEAWPSLVLVVITDDSGSPLGTCGGTVIAPEWVLTAGHCVRAGKGFFVLEGTNDLNRKGEGRRIDVRNAILQDGYTDQPEAHNDLGLLHLREPARSPAQLLLGRAAGEEPFKSGAQAMVAGFGLTTAQQVTGEHEGSPSSHLLETNLPVVERNACAQILDKAMNTNLDGIIDDATICAGDVAGGRDSCNGDSGGPLAYDLEGHRVQIGVVSWGPGCALKDTVGVYASVGHFENWIRHYAPAAVFYHGSGAPSQAPTSTSGLSSSIAAVEDAASSIGLTSNIAVRIREGSDVRIGDKIQFEVTSAIAGQLFLFNVDLASGRAYQIYPNKFTNGGSNLISADGPVVVPDANAPFIFRAKAPTGHDRLYAFILPASMRMDDIAARGLDMQDLDRATQLFDEIKERAIRGVAIEAAGTLARTRGAAVFDYVIRR